MAEQRPSQTQGLISGLLGGSLLGLLTGILATGTVKAATPEEQWARLIQLQEGQLVALARIVQILEGLTPTPTVPEEGEEPTIPQIVIKAEMKPGMAFVPLDPEGLNGAIQAMRLKGRTTFPTRRLTWACAFGALTNYTLTIPENWVCTRRACQISSDFYDPLITVNVSVDDELITPQALALTGVTVIDFGEFYVKRGSVRFATNNGSAVNAQLSLQITPALMEKSFYEEFYARVMSYMYSSLIEVAGGEV